MSVLNLIKKEFLGWGKTERFILPFTIVFIITIAIYMHDTTPAIISAFCGICATVLAGKGKISCYLFGIISNVCYSYISYKNQFWGNLGLNMLYYLPMQFVGIYNWQKHLKKETQEIYKTALNKNERMIYLATAIILSFLVYLLLAYYKDSNPLVDSITTILSVIAFILTVKRCIEQWYLWTIVNALCIIMWIGAYINGSHCFATILMWSVYFVLGIYFLRTWQDELKKESDCF